MDANIQRALNDKLYDKRKVGALESVSLLPVFPSHLFPCDLLLTCCVSSTRLERVIREFVAAKDYDRVTAILDQLCNEYAYAVHQPHARNGGLIGLAAAAIALGSVLSSLLLEFSHHRHQPFRTDISKGIASLPRSHRSTCSGLLHRSGCTRSVLCL